MFVPATLNAKGSFRGQQQVSVLRPVCCIMCINRSTCRIFRRGVEQLRSIQISTRINKPLCYKMNRLLLLSYWDSLNPIVATSNLPIMKLKQDIEIRKMQRHRNSIHREFTPNANSSAQRIVQTTSDIQPR